ncbi:probable ascorbate-specific transmembrane electron transporter 1 isoform X2 [Amborella trichopoda]|uniref:probable ascorbate-specific transmembrane electron transporter 1 isoform X2 n=1 Tax=Amborella trichopoda TaxID=13333 RepID=UPI0005D3A1A5|nr:probable ascorbate-specific transmembrane electron transporter 1 isoform X2 [Amborella trichopoda]|eukprot:XP_011626543.1 probable ascorbate-specific transmembrane electron transporter 1 isoform X2 [Amborella trichopoda]
MAAKDGSKLGMRARPWTLVALLLGVAASVLMLVWNIHFRGGLAFRSANKQLIFNIHPVLMFIGFIFVSGNGSKKGQKSIHMLLHLVALVLGITGVYAVFKFHRESKIHDMYSLHSWFGMGTICLYGLQFIWGFLFFWFPKVGTSRRSKLVPLHWFIGLILFLMATCTAEMGLLEKLTFLELFGGLKVYGREALLVNFTGIAILLFAIAVTLCVILP